MSRQQPRRNVPVLQEPLSLEEIGAFGRRLQRELEALQGEVDSVETDTLRPSGGQRFEASDELTEEASVDVELDALAVEDELGYEIGEALDRIREGTFGLCPSCGEWISRERLGVVPYARECRSCSRRHD